MNDEYLWQKTGEDPEIKKLENTLAVLRYRDVPLRIPAVETTVATLPVPRWKLSMAFAFAASVVVAILVTAVLLNISGGQDVETVFVASPDVEVAAPSPQPPPAATDEKKVSPAPVQKVVPQFAQSKRSAVIRSTPVLDRKLKITAPRPTSVAALTDEEKYAYRQLMLALSISSSKLKIVQDTINGNENIERTSSTNQR